MRLDDALRRAIAERNSRMLGRIVDVLRFQHSYQYEDIYKLVHRVTGGSVSVAEWDLLMEEADTDMGLEGFGAAVVYPGTVIVGNDLKQTYDTVVDALSRSKMICPYPPSDKTTTLIISKMDPVRWLVEHFSSDSARIHIYILNNPTAGYLLDRAKRISEQMYGPGRFTEEDKEEFSQSLDPSWVAWQYEYEPSGLQSAHRQLRVNIGFQAQVIGAAIAAGLMQGPSGQEVIWDMSAVPDCVTAPPQKLYRTRAFSTAAKRGYRR